MGDMEYGRGVFSGNERLLDDLDGSAFVDAEIECGIAEGRAVRLAIKSTGVSVERIDKKEDSDAS